MKEKEIYTKMIQEYIEIKEKNIDKLVLYRLGDFYEFFFEDAIKVNRLLNLTLTSRYGGAKKKIPMCGFPASRSHYYIEKLVKLGEKILIIEQNEVFLNNKKKITRSVDKIITLANIENEGIITQDNYNNYYLLSCYRNDNTKKYNILYGDLSIGKFYSITNIKNSALVTEYIRIIKPVQILLLKNQKNIHDFLSYYENKIEYIEKINDEFDNYNLDISDYNDCIEFKILLEYLKTLNINDLNNFQCIEEVILEKFLFLNDSTINSLELFDNFNNKNSFFDFINNTKTVLGARKLKELLNRPLYDYNKIKERLDSVEFFYNNYSLSLELKEILKNTYDLERLMSRILNNKCNIRDLFNLNYTLKSIENIYILLEKYNEKLLLIKNLYLNIDCVRKIYGLLNETINFEVDLNDNEILFLRKGINEEFDILFSILKENHIWIKEYEEKLKIQTGINSLKIRYNKIFGYFIEVNNNHKNNFINIDKFIHKQTLSNSSRYITKELKERENKLIDAKENIYIKQKEIFKELLEKIKIYKIEMQVLSDFISFLDIFIVFSDLSLENNYTRPIYSKNNELLLKGSRHPIIEKKIGSFIKNDIHFRENELFLITGPNMAGKSTFMRQIALIIIMHQIGCFVPADYAMLPLFDSIFTRIGAQDNISNGDSTFMVEMKEVSESLELATTNSLLIYDEIGRGTATFDGISISYSIIKYLLNNIKCKTFFSTHYHELIDLTKILNNIKYLYVSAYLKNDKIFFNYKLNSGTIDKSYGIHVAKLAGLPEYIIENSFLILDKISKNKDLKNIKLDKSEELNTNQYIELKKEYNRLKNKLDYINSLDINNITPLEAINIINMIQKKGDK